MDTRHATNAAPAPAPGLADPVFDAQRLFRAALEALSRPGTIQALPVDLTPPAPLTPWAAALALTLLDLETPVWLDPALEAQAVRDWLRFHAGCPLVATPDEAAFALVGDASALDDLSAFPIGAAEYPDQGATLIVQVAGLRADAGWTLSGPGIKGRTRLAVAGLPAAFPAIWAENAALHPQGVDIFLCAPHALAALPRSVTVRED
ncbi:phosphonate C-P lyase system protein PhnH [Roseospira navarrensis]|uniref:Phosphonate C-P lyase system protein PhnH n=1 Tax=Roseospira navarrensis TaxID=140058 RepID=A0A7X1ZDJ3_9PROT|nr:phosphonate C-P lyase system protein PhnH [Roseospira navarrensis]MQX36357.1 phosphonate C-P lyase system protein PhnH [Roseospira navarrensis]